MDMESERIEEWVDKVSIHGKEMILVRDFEELIKTEAIVPRNKLVDQSIIEAGRSVLPKGVDMWDYEIGHMYIAMIEAGEKV